MLRAISAPRFRPMRTSHSVLHTSSKTNVIPSMFPGPLGPRSTCAAFATFFRGKHLKNVESCAPLLQMHCAIVLQLSCGKPSHHTTHIICFLLPWPHPVEFVRSEVRSSAERCGSPKVLEVHGSGSLLSD